MSIQILFLVVALILFAMGAWSRWWGPPDRPPFYPTLVAGGLFFWVLSALWPLITK